jgi:hypothetical protein
MINLMNYPLFIFLLAVLAMSLFSWIGGALRKRFAEERDVDDAFHVVEGGTLTLLALIVGFTFSMAVSRYDMRKNCEEVEANAIGTEYLRAGLLPAVDTAKVRALLSAYLDQRILFYTTRSPSVVREINAKTAQLQTEMWSAVQAAGTGQPNPMVALAVAGMNDALDSQGFTQAAWKNRIPVEAWGLMMAMTLCSSMMVGYHVRASKRKLSLLLILPFTLSISFFLIADIDSPNGGLIHVGPTNLISLAESLRPSP